MQLKEKRTVGPDGLSSYFVKRCVKSIASPLLLLFNKPLVSGIIRLDWKKLLLHLFLKQVMSMISAITDLLLLLVPLQKFLIH